MSAGTIFSVTGAGLMVFALMQMYQFRRFIQETGSTVGVPFDIVAQTLAAFALCFAGAYLSMGRLRPMAASAEFKHRTVASTLYSPDFATFTHRGGAAAALRALAVSRAS